MDLVSSASIYDIVTGNLINFFVNLSAPEIYTLSIALKPQNMETWETRRCPCV